MSAMGLVNSLPKILINHKLACIAVDRVMTSHDIEDYFILNYKKYQEMITPLIEQRIILRERENRVFYDDINDSFNERVMHLISDDICLNLGVDYESVCVILEGINFEEHFK